MLYVIKVRIFGLFGNIQEAGGHATTLAGKKLPEGAFHDSLYLNPGPADHVPWSMLDGTSSFGMAGLLSIKGSCVVFKILDQSIGLRTAVKNFSFPFMQFLSTRHLLLSLIKYIKALIDIYISIQKLL